MRQMRHLGIMLLLVVLVAFNVKNSLEEIPNLIGTWQYENEPNNLWVFTKSKCTWKYEGSEVDTYTYSIRETKSSNGKLTIHLLKLVNVHNPSEVLEYEIDTFSDDQKVMRLVYQNGGHISYSSFIKTN
ncbi:hypothetical protein [Tenacibaculum sp. 190524A02b]